jgi:hypothetical protein
VRVHFVSASATQKDECSLAVCSPASLEKDDRAFFCPTRILLILFSHAGQTPALIILPGFPLEKIIDSFQFQRSEVWVCDRWDRN